MTTKSPTTLGAVLRNVDELPWNCSLYLPFGVVWSFETPCAVFDPDLENEDTLIEAGNAGLEYVLGIQQVQDIVSNLLAQKGVASEQDGLAAFLYYYDNDAFMDFSAQDAPDQAS